MARAAWWWIDRWRKSTAYTDMTLEEQGAYRNLIDELWLRGGVLPNDDRILAKICGDALAWARVREVVLRRFVLTAEGWRNPTHDEVAAGSGKFQKAQSVKGKKGAEKRWAKDGPAIAPANSPAIDKDAAPANGPGNGRTHGLPSPSPSPVPVRTPAIQSARAREDDGHQPPIPATEAEARMVATAVIGPHPGRANPLMGPGERPKWESECLRRVREESAARGHPDGAEVMALASDYPGARLTKLNPASMTVDRLMATVLTLRKWAAAREAPVAPVAPPDPAWAWIEAQGGRDAAVAAVLAKSQTDVDDGPTLQILGAPPGALRHLGQALHHARKALA